MTTRPSVDVGVLADPFVSNWQRTALQNVLALDGVDVTYVVADSSAKSGDEETVRTAVSADSIGLDDLKLFVRLLRERGAYPLVYADQKLEWMLGDESPRQRYMRSEPLEAVECLSDATVDYCEPVPVDENWNELPDSVVDELVASTDVVLRFGFGLLTGRILEEPKYGVLSTHGSDIREWRGLGPQIAFLRDADEMTVTLQQLTDDVDGGNVVEMLSKPARKPYTLSEAWAWTHELQAEIYARGIQKLRDPDFSPEPPDELGTYYPLSTKRNASFVRKILLKNNLARAKKAVANS